jgi:hypothetical protein
VTLLGKPCAILEHFFRFRIRVVVRSPSWTNSIDAFSSTFEGLNAVVHLLADVRGDEPTHGMGLPAGQGHNCFERGAPGLLQKRNDSRRLRVSARRGGPLGCSGYSARFPPLSPPEAACAPTWGSSRSMALQIRLTPVCRSVNLATFRTPGRLFQTSTSRPPGQCAASEANCFSFVNCAAPLFEPRSVEVETATSLPASMVKIRMASRVIAPVPQTVKRNLPAFGLDLGLFGARIAAKAPLSG